jgi:hypothetical protein
VNVPDVARGAFALSGLVVRTGEGAAASESIDSDRFTVRPADALRVYPPGTELSYSYEIYNAGAAVQAVTSLWRGTERIIARPPDALASPSPGRAFIATGALKLPDDLPSGAYVLQIAATSGERPHTTSAVQRLSFDVK